MFDVAFGLRHDQASCTARVARNGTQLSITVSLPGGDWTGSALLVHPTAGLLAGGPLDLRLAYVEGSLYLAWRRSDRDEPWLPWVTAGELLTAAPPASSPAWVSVERADTPTSGERVVTFGTVEFGVHCGKITPPGRLDESVLQLAPLAAADTAVVVVKPRTAMNDKSELSLGLRPPSTDLETWSAWHEMDRRMAGSPLDRVKIWSTHKVRTGLPQHPQETNRPDGTLDDPAVDQLLVELVPLVTAAPETVKRVAWRPADNSGADDLAAVQRLAGKFSIVVWPQSVSVSTGQRLVNSGGTFEIQIKEQEIWSLRVYPAVPRSYFHTGPPAPKPGEQRFHSRFGDGPSFQLNGVAHRLFAPWEVTLEAATAEVITAATPADQQALLHAAIAPSFNGREVAVSLRKQSPRAYRYASEVRLERQVWRWRGRPVPAFPFDSNQATFGGLDRFPIASPLDSHDPELDTPSWPMIWDGIGFGDRTAIDLLDQTSAITADQPDVTLFTENLTRDARALYYRFTAQARARYAPMYPEHSDRELEVQATVTDPHTADSRNAWRRLLVPCRAEVAPPPPIRCLVPLTEPEEENVPAGVPGLLVVLDDSWFARGGLAEVLDAEIAEGADYFDTTGADAPLRRPEFGPDPTLTGKGWTRAAVGEPDPDGHPNAVPKQSLAMNVVGPIGHTFDTDADAPLYNASSFIVRPPRTAGILGGTSAGLDSSLDWYFAKVRFRRLLLPEAAADYRLPTPQTIRDPVDVPLQLSPEGAWSVDVAMLTLMRATGATSSLSVVLSHGGSGDPLGTGKVTLAIDGDSVELTWDPDDDKAAGGKAQIAPLDPAAWTFVQIDLRFLLQRDESMLPPEAEGNVKPPRHLTVQYRLRGVFNDDPVATASARKATAGPQRTWQSLATQLWEGNDWPTLLTLSATGVAQGCMPVVLPARLSAFTPAYWIQFLPDAQMRLELEKLWSACPPHDGRGDCQLQLKWLPPGTDDILSWQLLCASPDGTSPNVTDKLPQTRIETVQASDVFLERRIVLTELVSDIRGQLGEERYLGMYQRVSSGGTECLQEIHRSGAVRQSANIMLGGASRRLRVRIVEVQAVRIGGNEPSLTADIWDKLFPSADEDARARIVRVSPPIDLYQSP